MAEQKHILIVEDEAHLAHGIKFNLDDEGYLTSIAPDGPTALRLIDEIPSIGLVILDLMLPGMSGYAVCEALRQSGNHVPVLMLSARNTATDSVFAKANGASAFVSTVEGEFDHPERGLVATVRRLLNG